MGDRRSELGWRGMEGYEMNPMGLDIEEMNSEGYLEPPST